MRVQIEGDHIRCWLDGELLHDVHRPKLAIQATYASATQDKATGDVILKVVSTAASPTETTIDLKGIRKLPGKAHAMVLTSADPSDENSLEEPRKVSPKSEAVTISGTKLLAASPVWLAGRQRAEPGNGEFAIR